MKKIIFIVSIIAFIGTTAKGQKQVDTITFKVSGNCEMCKETIEESVNTGGVKSGVWDMKTGKITVIYKSKRITEEEIHRLISESGYETEKLPANEDAYRNLPGCCQYSKDLHK